VTWLLQGIKAEPRGVRQDPTTPYYFVDAFGRPMSPWHDLPLYSPASSSTTAAKETIDPSVVSFVCEIPRGTRAKYEISTGEAFNPLVQDRNKDGSPRFYAFPSLSNYGALPQTYEDPDSKDAKTGMPGDGDPLDICEIGLRSKAEVVSFQHTYLSHWLALPCVTFAYNCRLAMCIKCVS
jgi:hypothetical protein